MRMTGYPSIDKPWLKFYEEKAVKMKMPECSIYELLVEKNKDYPNDIAIEYMGTKITYKQLFRKIDETAAAFLGMGVKEGEIVTLTLPSIPEALYCVYALNKINAVPNMVHPLAGESDIRHYIDEVKSRIVVMFDGTYEIVKDSVFQTTCEHAVVVSPAVSLPPVLKQLYLLKNPAIKTQGDKLLSWKDFMKKGNGIKVVEKKRDPHGLSLISHTGGTTGFPKGVMCTDFGLVSHILAVVGTMPHERQDRLLVVLPPFINYSLVTSMLLPLSEGITTVLIPKYEAEKLDYYIKKLKPNHMASIPAYWEALLDVDSDTDYSGLKNCFYGGEKMAEEKEDQVNEVFKKHGATVKLRKGLGSTEIVSAATATLKNCNVRGSVGIPLIGINCKIVEPETENEVLPNTEGEICFAGNQLMLGYYDNEEETNNLIHVHKDGLRWMHTGDLGHMDEDGVLFITGRIKRIIMTRGSDGMPTKMFPDRIERTIMMDKRVLMCCMIGVPDDFRINYPKAYVVIDPSVENQDEVKAAIKKNCEQNLPDYMNPDVFVYMDNLPRTDRGKVDYRALERLNEEEMAAGTKA